MSAGIIGVASTTWSRGRGCGVRDGARRTTAAAKQVFGDVRGTVSIASMAPEASEVLFSEDCGGCPTALLTVEERVGYVQRLAVAELAEGIAHDLNNQLTVVVASVQLARAAAEGVQSDLLERAWRGAMRAAHLMDEMLRYTHGSRGPSTDADAAEALETAVAGAWAYCSARGVHLEMRQDPDLPRVVGCASALRVLVLHLLRWVVDRCPPESRLVAEACANGGDVSIRMHSLDVLGRECMLRSRAGVLAPMDSGIESAVLQALANQAGVRLAHEGACPELLLRAATGPSRQWEGGLGVQGLREGSAGGDLGRGGAG